MFRPWVRRVFPAIFYTHILEHMKKLHILIIIVVLVCVLLGFGIIHGFHDYPTQVIHSDQPNDSYLEALMIQLGMIDKH